MTAVDDRLPSEFVREPRMVFAQVARNGHRPARAAIAQFRRAQIWSLADVESVTPSITRALEPPGRPEDYRPGHQPMCDLLVSHGLESLEHDEWILDVPLVRSLIGDVRAAVARSVSAAEVCRLVEPSFNQLLTEPEWLPAEFQQDAPQSGMGGGIGQWLLFRAADRSLCLFSLVVPSGSMTPVHDHLAWGLVGLYKGNQDEEFYKPGDGQLHLVRQRPLEPGDHYLLLPPRDDVHRVRTTSNVTSVSIHLLANDTGCVLRHTFDEQTGQARPFRSGYVNAACREPNSPRRIDTASRL